MNSRIVNLNDIDLDAITVPEHPCMPDITNIQEDTWVVVNQNTLEAICSLWTRRTPAFDSDKTAVVGNFFTGAVEAGVLLLHHVSTRLKVSGFDCLVGPMNGDTWHSYRLVTDTGGHPPFFMEYYCPEMWASIFTLAGFKPIAHYHSAKVNNTGFEDASAMKFAAKKSQLSLTVKPFDMAQARSELTAIHALSKKSFANNFLYTDITLADFLLLYEKMIPCIDPEFFLLAKQKGQLVGFIFAVPDYCQKERGEEIDTLIIKTLARAPDRAYAGLGSYLAYKLQSKAVDNNFTNIIHALMSDDNASSAISDKSAKTIRQYALYGKRLRR